MTFKFIPENEYRAVVAARIERDSIPVTESGCWVWMRKVDGDGYARTTLRTKSALGHRVSWFAYRGEIPEGLCVLHRCDVPACVNPDHLFLGTQLENIADRVRKNRTYRGDGSRRGDGNPNSKARRAQRCTSHG